MKIKTSLLAGLILIGSMASTAMAADGVLLKEEIVPGSNYCHMQFKATEPLQQEDNPGLEGPQSADVIDFYGPCDESPTGPDQIRQQKLDQLFFETYP